jgi:hypothetical protein
MSPGVCASLGVSFWPAAQRVLRTVDGVDEDVLGRRTIGDVDSVSRARVAYVAEGKRVVLLLQTADRNFGHDR